jgi:hypothetical protein
MLGAIEVDHEKKVEVFLDGEQRRLCTVVLSP